MVTSIHTCARYFERDPILARIRARPPFPAGQEADAGFLSFGRTFITQDARQDYRQKPQRGENRPLQAFEPVFQRREPPERSCPSGSGRRAPVLSRLPHGAEGQVASARSDAVQKLAEYLGGRAGYGLMGKLVQIPKLGRDNDNYVVIAAALTVEGGNRLFRRFPANRGSEKFEMNGRDLDRRPAVERLKEGM
ncbi:hypothetical protein [Paracoccus aminophilus]|uniref:hypothetical protein n=1 Tax=Paracoccus aminophilus TaxID=34003 RepID=UPI0011DD2678|nr:hypothetical protein [Paracoccus aminophilus]